MAENPQEDKIEGDDELFPVDYPFKKVNIERKYFSLFELKRKSENETRKDILINPDFQRNDVWEKKQKKELIESILMDIPLPNVYFFQRADGKQQVVDGRQRLTAIFEFMNNKFKLSDLRILKEHNDKYFKDFDPVLQAKIEEYQIEAYVIQPPTPERIKFDIFDRVNRGGSQLNNQEMRNALYQGKSTKLIEELAKSEEFKNATDVSIPDKRMKGRYIIIRFLSFYMLWNEWLKESGIEYKSDIDDFLAKTMSFINKLPDEKINNLKEVFLQAMDRSYKTIGKDGFRFLSNDGGNKRPINMALFEALAFLFSNDCIDSVPHEIIKNRIEEKKKVFDSNGNFATPTDSSTKVKNRFLDIDKLLEELKNDRKN